MSDVIERANMVLEERFGRSVRCIESVPPGGTPTLLVSFAAQLPIEREELEDEELLTLRSTSAIVSLIEVIQGQLQSEEDGADA